MDALLMCGGRGTRLDSTTEKPLFDVGGRPMVEWVHDALTASDVDATHAVVSPHAPETRDHLADSLPLLETPGDGYVDDLRIALEYVDTPVLTVAADLPLLEADVVDTVLSAANGSTSVRIPAALTELLGTSVDVDATWVPTGVNVVGDDHDTVLRSYDARLAVNVNQRCDAEVAERLLDARSESGSRNPAGRNANGP